MSKLYEALTDLADARKERNLALDFDLAEFRTLISLHDAACESWDDYADPARCSMEYVRVKNKTEADFSNSVISTLRELQRLRGQRKVLEALLGEAAEVLTTVDGDSADEDDALRALRDRIADARGVLWVELAGARGQ
jgi:hypothetical protein